MAIKKVPPSVSVMLLSTAHNPLFDAVFHSNHNIVGVIAQGQSRQTGSSSARSALDTWCRKRNIPLIPYAEEAQSLNKIKSLNADVLVVSRAMRVSDKVLGVFKYGGINVHPSKLPGYRGGSPLFWQVVDQVEELTASVHKMTEVFDQGDILAWKSAAKPCCGTEKQILREIAILESSLIVNVLDNFNELFYRAKPQPKKTTTRYASYVSAKNIEKVIDLNGLSIEQCVSALRFVQHWPCRLVNVKGFYKLFLWWPQKIIKRQAEDVDEGAEFLVLKRKGLIFYASHPEGWIQFSPRFSLKSMLRRIGRR